jgi:hypothetical protein
MHKLLSATQVLLITLLLTILSGWSGPGSECVAADRQHVVTTKHTIVTFNSARDMATFNAAIKFGPSSLSSIFSSSSLQDSQNTLVRKVDALFQKVQRILDMRKEMRKIRIRVYSNAAQLHAAYEKIYKEKCEVRGWYVYEFNTVFLNVEDVHEGMLAHELGHAIIDHYLSVRPPRATAEILAKYVDMHLHEEVKEY